MCASWKARDRIALYWSQILHHNACSPGNLPQFCPVFKVNQMLNCSFDFCIPPKTGFFKLFIWGFISSMMSMYHGEFPAL